MEGDAREYAEHTKPISSQDGFALVEILVALVLVGLIAGLSVGFFGQLRILNAASQKNAVQLELDAVVRYIETAIEGAMPTALLGRTDDQRLYLAGAAHSVHFVMIARTGFASRALRETTIEVNDEPDRGVVQRLQPRRFTDHEQRTGAQTIILLSGDAELRFRYLAHSDDKAIGPWTDDWNAPLYLPAAVSIVITLERDGTLYTSEGLAVLAMAKKIPDAEPTL